MKFKMQSLRISFSLLLSVSLFTNAQTKSSISGTIVEQDTKQPAEFVNVSLFHAGDSTVFMGVTSNKNGEYNFTNVPSGKYYIQLNSMGYDPESIPVFSVSNTPVTLGTSKLKVANILLDDVSVVHQQSTLNSSIDRKTYNVEKDILGQTGSASQILENIPSVTVDVDGTVSLRGSTNVTFFVNGRPSSLLKHNSAVALQQIPASTIERIEVITNPSAKYKPDGIGGIINLVLKKEKQQGFNGMIMANAGNQGRYNANLTMNYNTGKMNIFGSYGFRRNNSPRTSYDYRINRDSMLNVINTYESNSSAQARPISQLGNFGLDYQFNENNKLELAGNVNFQEMHRTQNTLSTLKDKNENISSQYNTYRINDEPEKEWETSAVFSHQFKKEGHEIQFEFNLTGYSESEKNQYTESYTVPAGAEDLSNVSITKGGPKAEFYAE